MNLNDITNKVSDKDIHDLAKTLGYNSTTNFQRTYDKFKQAETLSNWLGSGYYDLVNTAENFLSKLAKIADIDIEQDIVSAKEYLIEKAKFKDSYIIAITDFKRGNQNNFTMGADLNKRKLSLYGNEELLFKSEQDVLGLIPQIIDRHYKANANNILGNVMYYEVYLPFGKYKFDI